jgi:hypothetical protein
MGGGGAGGADLPADMDGGRSAGGAAPDIGGCARGGGTGGGPIGRAPRGGGPPRGIEAAPPLTVPALRLVIVGGGGGGRVGRFGVVANTGGAGGPTIARAVGGGVPDVPKDPIGCGANAGDWGAKPAGNDPVPAGTGAGPESADGGARAAGGAGAPVVLAAIATGLPRGPACRPSGADTWPVAGTIGAPPGRSGFALNAGAWLVGG